MDPASASIAPWRRTLVILSAMMSTAMVAIDTTIANVALPHMQASMSASQEQVVWVLTSYMIASAIATPLGAWLASRYGRKLVMVASSAGFTLASLACGAATTLPMLVAARLAQGAFGASLVPLSQAMMLDITPPEQHGRAMAVYGTGTMFGPLIGPTLGGFLTDALSWRWVFLINLPLGLIAVFGMGLLMTEKRDPNARPFDRFGFFTMAIFLAAFQLLLDRGQQLDWLDSREVCLEAGVMVAFLWLAGLHMITAKRPFIQPRLFANRNFAIGCLISAAVGVISFAPIPFVTVMIQQVLGYPAMATGIISSPRGIGTLTSMLVVGRLIGRFDTRFFLFCGLALTAFGLHLLSGFNLMVSQSALMTAGLCQGLGSGLMMVPLTTMTFSTLDPSWRNEGTALFALVRNMGSSLGISWLQTQATHNIARVQSRLVEGLRPDNPMLAFTQPGTDPTVPATAAGLNGSVGLQAVMVSYIDTFWLLCLIALALMPIALTMRPPRRLSRISSRTKVD